MNEQSLIQALNRLRLKEDMRRRLVTKLGQSKKPLLPVVLKMAAIAGLAVCVLFGSALAVSEEFRGRVIAFFKSEQVERPPAGWSEPSAQPSDRPSDQPSVTESTSPSPTPPGAAPGVRFIESQEIEGIASIRYFDLGEGFLLSGGYIKAPEGYYKIDGESLIPVETLRCDTTVTYRGREFDLDFVYVIEEGELDVLVNYGDSIDDGMASAHFQKERGILWVSFSVRREYLSYIEYNPATGEMRDVFTESGLNEAAGSEIVDVSFSGDRLMMLVHTQAEKHFLLNTQTYEFHELNLGADMSMGFIDSQTLSVWEYEEIGNDYVHHIYRYDLDSRELTCLLRGIPYSLGGERPGIMGLGGRYAMLTQETQYALLDLKTGEEIPIGQITPGTDIRFLRSPGGQYISVTGAAELAELGYAQMGFIHIEKQMLTIFDRQDFADIRTTSCRWLDDDSLVVTAANTGDDGKYVFIYDFRVE